MSPVTQNLYRYAGNSLVKYARTKNLENVSEDRLLEYLNTFDNPGSRNKAFCVLRKFYNEYLGLEYFAGMKYQRVKQKYEFLDWSPENTQWMIEACQNLRDKAMLAVLCECGFRRQELLSIKLSGVKFDEYGVLLTCTDSKTQTKPSGGSSVPRSLRAG